MNPIEIQKKLDISLIANYILSMVKTESIIALVASVREKANKFITEELKRRGITDISTPHGGIFIHLLRNGEMTMGELARKIDRDKSTVTALVRRLVDLGYLETSTSPSDNRITIVKLTRKGTALENDFNDISKGLQEKVYQSFSDLEKEMLVRLLMRVNSNF
jgi:MarR family transcriptional regulator, organic hydroperoxide resistance regulator